jgi:hypothetical protein
MGNENLFQERADGPTPNGGTHSIAFFCDKDGRQTTKDKAEIVDIVEYDSADREIYHTRMVLDQRG